MTFATLSTSVDRYVPASGSTRDNFGRVMAALDDAQSTLAGGNVILGPGVHLFDNPRYKGLLYSPFNSGNRGRVSIVGDGATVLLSNNTPRFLDFAETVVGTGDTFSWLRIADLIIDAANVGGRHHVLCGTFKTGVVQSRINLAHMLFERIRMYNVLTDSDTATNHRLGAWMAVGRSAAGTGEGAPNTITDITFKDVRQEGGNAGLAIAGTGPGVDGLEVYIDDALMEDCFHDALTAPTAFFGASNFHIGSRGYGGSATIRRCTGRNSADVGIETNAIDHMVVEDCEIQENFNIAYYHTNYHTPDHPATQKVSYKSCRTVGESTSVNGSQHGFGMAQNLSIPLGTVEYEKCLVRRDFQGGEFPATLPNLVRMPTSTQIRKLRIRGMDIEVTGFVSTGAKVVSLISLVPSTVRATLDIKDVNIRTVGTNNGGTLSLKGLNFAGLATMTIEDFHIEHIVSGASLNGLQGMDLGTVAGSSLRGSIRRFKVIANGDDTQPRGIIVRGTDLLTIDGPFVIGDCDFKPHVAGASDILYVAPSNAAQVVETNNVT